MRLYKQESGVILNDFFDELSSEWSVSDNANIEINSGLTLRHSQNKDVFVLRDIPSAAGAFEVLVDYTPILEKDMAGLVLFNNLNANVELLEYTDVTQSDLENIKVIRDTNEYTFLMMRDGEYELIDAVEYPFNKIGFVTKSGPTNFKDFKVNQFIATKNDRLQVTNLVDGFSISLEFEGVILAADSGVDGIAEVTLPNLQISGILRIYDEGNEILLELDHIFYGGDVWSLGSFLQIRKNGQPLSDFDLTRLGRITNNMLEVQLELYNPSSINARNVNLSVVKYTTEFGDEWTEVALDEDGEPSAFDKSLHIDVLGSGETRLFWIRIEKMSAVTQNSAIYFAIKLEHE